MESPYNEQGHYPARVVESQHGVLESSGWPIVPPATNSRLPRLRS